MAPEAGLAFHLSIMATERTNRPKSHSKGIQTSKKMKKERPMADTFNKTINNHA
jgi:hypothetical protein